MVYNYEPGIVQHYYVQVATAIVLIQNPGPLHWNLDKFHFQIQKGKCMSTLNTFVHCEVVNNAIKGLPQVAPISIIIFIAVLEWNTQ